MKCYVRNRAQPEGLIVEAYIADECLTFYSRYMDDVDTRFNQERRNNGFLMNKLMVLMSLGMELILLQHLSLFMMKKAFIKWCGMG